MNKTKRKVGLYMVKGWKKPIMFYQFKCPKHGIVINYPKGFNDRLECPICFNETNEKLTTLLFEKGDEKL